MADPDVRWLQRLDNYGRALALADRHKCETRCNRMGLS